MEADLVEQPGVKELPFRCTQDGVNGLLDNEPIE
jgi:hypothetical protein